MYREVYKNKQTIITGGGLGLVPRQTIEQWLDEYIAHSGYSDIQSVYVEKDKKTLVERYYNGCNALTRYPADEMGYLMIALLTGVAIDKRILRSVEVPIGTYLTEFMLQYYTLYHRMKVKHLLTMTSGIEYEDKKDAFRSFKLFHTVDSSMIDMIVKLPLTQVPGLRYQYKKVDIIILCAFLQNILNKQLSEFCNDTILRPLHIKDGFTSDMGSLLLSAREYAAIGDLMLHDGYYENHKVISSGYVKEMVAQRLPNKSFGYQMRLYPNGYGTVARNGSQMLVLPNENLVFVIIARKSKYPRYYGGIVSGILDFLK